MNAKSSDGCQQQIDATNVCSSDICDFYDIPGFCAPDPGILNGDANRTKYCSMLGENSNGDKEWQRGGSPSFCIYNTCNQSNVFTRKLCGCGCCGVAGGTSSCQRVAFYGDPLKCCIRDYACNKSSTDDSACFETAEKKATCHPLFRDITSTIPVSQQTNFNCPAVENAGVPPEYVNKSCSDIIRDYCSGDPSRPQDTSWFTNWTTPEPNGKGMSVCEYAIERNVHNVPGFACDLLPTEFSSEGILQASILMEQAIGSFNDAGYQLGAIPGTSGYNDIQNTFYRVCNKYPGVCENALQTACSKETLNSVLANPSKVQWCGCYLPDEQYAQYTDDFGITKECSPSCARIGVIPLATPDGTAPQICKQNVCLIDNITLGLSQTTINGEITFAQYCGGCTGVCDCTIVDETIEIASSELGGINFTQNCGGNVKCLRTNPDPLGSPRTLEVDCNTPLSTDVFSQNSENNKKSRNSSLFSQAITVLIIVGIALIIALIIVALAKPANITPTYSKSTYSKSTKKIQRPQKFEKVSGNYFGKGKIGYKDINN